jgi:ABC-type uncharacterized transport system auxiliary subunit
MAFVIISLYFFGTEISAFIKALAVARNQLTQEIIGPVTERENLH